MPRSRRSPSQSHHSAVVRNISPASPLSANVASAVPWIASTRVIATQRSRPAAPGQGVRVSVVGRGRNRFRVRVRVMGRVRVRVRYR